MTTGEKTLSKLKPLSYPDFAALVDPVVEVAGDDAVRPEQVAGGLPLNGDAVEVLTLTMKIMLQFSDETGDNHCNPIAKSKKMKKGPKI